MKQDQFSVLGAGEVLTKSISQDRVKKAHFGEKDQCCGLRGKRASYAKRKSNPPGQGEESPVWL